MYISFEELGCLVFSKAELFSLQIFIMAVMRLAHS